MTRADPTYADLFAFLEHLGFRGSSPSEGDRVFEHDKLEILLAYAMLDDSFETRPVRAADLISTEFRLQQHRLLSGNIRMALHGIEETNG